MPISSTEISNIIATQVGMFGQSSQYAQAVSAMYGFQGGGASVQDPRSSQHLSAGNMGSAAARAPGFAMGALGMGAMFGMGPAMLDPFTSTFRMATHGFRGGGIGGAIGMGGAAMGAYAGMGAMGSFATNQMATGAQNRGMLMNQMGGMMPNAGAGALGFMANQVEQAARGGMGDIRQITGMMQQGVSGGQIDTGSISSFTTSFQKLLGNVRQVAQVLNTSLTEAQQAMQTVKSMGITSDRISQTIATMKGVGGAIGASPAQMAQVGARGAAFGRAAGIDPGMGAMGAMTTAGVFGIAQKTMPSLGLMAGDQGRYTQGALRFLTSGRGRNVLGAMYDPSTGGLNEETAQMMSMGAYDRGEIARMSSKNLSGNRSSFRARQGELAGQFVSQFGPGGVAPALNAQTAGPKEDLLRQTLTGLTRRDLGTLDQLSNQGPALRQRLVDEARRGFTEGQNQQLTLGGAMSMAMDQLTKPLREKFQKFGASLTQAIAGATQDLSGEFVRRYSGASGGGTNELTTALRTGNMGRYQQLQNMSSGARGMGAGDAQWGMARGEGLTGAIGRSVPMALRMAALPPGTGFGDLDMGGMANEEYNPYMTGAWMAGGYGGFGGGRNVIGAAGKGLTSAGGGWNRAFGGPQMGFMGLGGYGPVQGTARMAGGLTQGAGWAMRGLGGAARAAAPFMMAGDLATNLGPQARRSAGYGQIQSGGLISGNQGDLLRFLDKAGVISAPMMNLSGMGGSSPRNMQPISGYIPGEAVQTAGGASFSGPGKQQFIDEANLSLANQFMENPTTAAKLRARLGAGRVDGVLSAAGAGGAGHGEKLEKVSNELGISRAEAAALMYFDSNDRAQIQTGDALSALGTDRDATKARKAARNQYGTEYERLFSSDAAGGNLSKLSKQIPNPDDAGGAHRTAAAAAGITLGSGEFRGVGGDAVPTASNTHALEEEAVAGRALLGQIGKSGLKTIATGALGVPHGAERRTYIRERLAGALNAAKEQNMAFADRVPIEQIVEEMHKRSQSPWSTTNEPILGGSSGGFIEPATEQGARILEGRGRINSRLQTDAARTRARNTGMTAGPMSGLGTGAFWHTGAGGAGGQYSDTGFLRTSGGSSQFSWDQPGGKNPGFMGIFNFGVQPVTSVDDPQTEAVEAGDSQTRTVDFREVARKELGERFSRAGQSGKMSADQMFQASRQLHSQGYTDMGITAAKMGQMKKGGMFKHGQGSKKFWEEFGGVDWKSLTSGERIALKHGVHRRGATYTTNLEATFRSKAMELLAGVPNASQGQIDALTSKIQAAGASSADSEERLALANDVAGLSVPSNPGGGTAGSITQQVAELQGSLANLKRYIDLATGGQSVGPG